MYRKEVDDANVPTLATTHLHRMKKFIRNRWGFVYPSPLLYNRFLEGIRTGEMEIVEKVTEKCRFVTDMGSWGRGG